jgi:hypothetical protein
MIRPRQEPDTHGVDSITPDTDTASNTHLWYHDLRFISGCSLLSILYLSMFLLLPEYSVMRTKARVFCTRMQVNLPEYPLRNYSTQYLPHARLGTSVSVLDLKW